jgi:type 1 glutamine amidotransferase
MRDIDDFEVVDEIYSFLDVRDVTPLLTSPRRGIEQPLLWVRSVRGGRVIYDALGHDDRSLTQPAHAEIIRRAAEWALRGAVST